jgi:hypothetical protein
MSMRDEVMDIKNELKEVKEQSLALELLSDYKKSNKRIFTALIIVLVMWFITTGYLVYILNDISVITNEQEITDVENIDNSEIINGG